MKCGHCNCEIISNSWAPLYRTCDSYVCSPECSMERYKVITNLDPKLTHCMLWADTTTIAPPKTFERKESYVTLGSLLGKANRISDTRPILNNNDTDAENGSAIIDVENNNIMADNILDNTPRRSILCMTMETLAIVCVSTVTVGVIILTG